MAFTSQTFLQGRQSTFNASRAKSWTSWWIFGWGSPTFGQWDAVELDEQSRRAVYVSEGLGHAFCALSESATVGYLCSEPYAPTREHGIHPLDPDLSLPWPDPDAALLSPKDEAAPSLVEAMADGLLPHYEVCRLFTAGLAPPAAG